METKVSYYIFKTDHLTGRTYQVCNGSYADDFGCGNHWRVYVFGFMDCAAQFGCKLESGTHPRSFRLTDGVLVDVEFFMLTGDDGRALVEAISAIL